MRVERGSPELIASYKQQILALNDRIHELEQEKSNLKAELVNLRNEYDVRLSVQNFNSQIDIKKSSVTDYHDVRSSDATSLRATEARNLTSPVQKYNINSAISSPKDEGFGIKMVDSKIEPSSNNKTPTYGLTDSRQSGTSSSKEQQSSSYGVSIGQATSTYQTPASSSVSGGSGVYGSSLSGSGVQYQQYSGTSNLQNAPTYQASSSGVYQAGTYQSSTGSGVYQSGTGSGVYQAGSGVYQAGSGVYQSGTGVQGGSGVTYQGGNYQPTTSFQSGSYQPYQPGTSGSSFTSSYQQGTYKPTTGTSGTPGSQGATGSSQFSSSSTYRYEKK